jgi:ABC-type transport system involved in Fe-S cluster assembly fused permease/ATPase subunit
MGPYIAPSGKWNRAVVFSMWFIVAASKASTLAAPIILGNAVSNISHRDLQGAAVQLIIYGVLQLIPTVLESFQDVVSAFVWMAAYREVAEKSFTTVLHLDLHWHLTKKLGGVMRSIDRGMNSTERLMSWIAMWAVPNVATGVLSFVIFATHFRQPELAAVCWISLCLYVWITILITKVRRKFNEEQNVHDNDANANSTDTLIAIEVVKSFTNEEHEIKRYVDEVKKMQTFNYKGQVYTAGLNNAQGTIIQICTVATLVLAGIHAVHDTPLGGVVSIATFVAVQQYLSNLFAPFSFLGSLYSMCITALVDVQNLADIMDEKPDQQDRPDAVEFRSRFPKISNSKDKNSIDGVSVEFDDVHFHYPTQDADKGLHNISFKMEIGTTTALCGTTGAGKSSISKLIFSFFEPQSGKIKFNGCDAKDFTAISLRREIGIVPQDTTLFNNTLKYNIAYGRLDATDEEIDEAVRIAQLRPTLERLSQGLQTVVGERGARLSGGERQRVAIARCILKNPSILIFDEATSALDSSTEKELNEALKVLSGGRRTSLVVAHRLSTIQNAHQIIVMEKGRIIEKGKHDELLEMKGQYFKMWEAQKKEAEEEEQKKQASIGGAIGDFEAKE